MSGSASLFLSQIIYPVSLRQVKSHAYLIGWNLEHFRCCIVCVILLPASEESIQVIEEGLASDEFNRSFDRIIAECSIHGNVKPIILGEWIPDIIEANHSNNDANSNNHSSFYTLPSTSCKEKSIWLTLVPTSDNKTERNPLPVLYSVYSLGFLYKTSCYMIEYHNIDTNKLCCLKLEYQKLESDGNNIPVKSNGEANNTGSDRRSRGDIDGDTYNRRNDVDARRDIIRNYSSREKLSRFSENSKSLSSMQLTSDIQYIAAQINASHDLELLLNRYIATKLALHAKYAASSDSGSFSLSLGLLGNYSVVVLQSLILLSYCWHVIIATIKYVLNIKFVKVSPSIQSLLGVKRDVPSITVCLADISLTAAYLSEKLTLIEHSLHSCASFPISMRHPVPIRQHIWTTVSEHSIETVVDTLIGVLLSCILYRNIDAAIQIYETFSSYYEKKWLLDTLDLFNQSPLGVKLNHLITAKLGVVLTFLLNLFGSLIKFHGGLLPYLFQLVTLAGGLGVTVQLSTIVDIIRLLTLHIAVIHRIFGILHNFQLRIVHSLWYLFQGQKINILRQRVDTCEYDRQQLFLGTVLFSIFFFLFPSLAVYFYLFACAQVVIVLLQIIVWILVIMIKEFPGYVLYTYIWTPYITSDIQFQIGVYDNTAAPSVVAASIPVSDSYTSKSSLMDRLTTQFASLGQQQQHSSSPSSNTASGNGAVASDKQYPDTIYLKIGGRPLTVGLIFNGYVSHWKYFKVVKNPFLLRILNGLLLGRPALESHLIRSNTTLAAAKLAALTSSISSLSTDRLDLEMIRSCDSLRGFWTKISLAKDFSLATHPTELLNENRKQQRLCWQLFRLVVVTYTISFVAYVFVALIFLYDVTALFM
jgi:hypothetical protein